jgi:hypothetical protein
LSLLPSTEEPLHSAITNSFPLIKRHQFDVCRAGILSLCHDLSFRRATPGKQPLNMPRSTEARSPSKPNGAPLRATPHYGKALARF